MRKDLNDTIGKRGERIAQLCLPDFSSFDKALFRVAGLEKWPAMDFFVELEATGGIRPIFLAQVKTTTSGILASGLPVSTKRRDISVLLWIPAPTYILGVHEPTRRVFIRSVHQGSQLKAIRKIPPPYKLTRSNLQVLHQEVV